MELGHFSRKGAIAATRSLLNKTNPLDAIFCANDYMAMARYEFGFTVDLTIDLTVATDIGSG